MVRTSPSQLECPRCGAQVVGRDFCACGEYLAWEATLAPVPEPVVHLPPEPAPDPTLLTLRDPARDDEPGATVAVEVVPGGDVTVLATIRNQGPIVDTFDVRVDGLPDGWWTIAPPTVFLNPWGTSGDYEQEVQVRLHPPKTAAAEARAWPLAVVVHSRSLATDVACAQATLLVQPFQSTVMYAGPERRRGRRRASFDVVVSNHGNSPLEIVVAAQDSEARCPVAIANPRATVAFGQTVATVVRVGVPAPLIFGRPTDHHIEVTHRATGVDSTPTPQRVTFRQRPWLPWWVPPALALLAAFVAAMLLLRREPEVPKLDGDTVAEARVVLGKHDLELGRVSYAKAPENTALDTIIAQQPAAGDEIVKGEAVHIVLAAPPETGFVPEVNGRSLAAAAAALKDARFEYSAEPASAGDDWVVIRQNPTPGTERELGTPVTLAVEKATPEPTPTPTATPTPAATATPAAAPKPAAKQDRPAKRRPTATAAAALPADFVFAGATSGQLYRLDGLAAKPARLTSPRHRFETPTTTDDGYAAVQVTDDGRHLARISADGKTVGTIAAGDFHRPAYSPDRGLLAVIAGDGRRGPADAGALCVLDPAESAPACTKARARGRRLGRPAWAPSGRSVLVLAARPRGAYDELLVYAARGGDAARWGAPTVAYRAAGLQAAAWVGSRRVAVLVAARPGAAAHLRLLALRADGRLEPVKEFPALTGHELAAKGRHLALRRGQDATGDGALVVLDVDAARPRTRRLSSGVNPAWAH
jgi:hypothetical protein